MIPLALPTRRLRAVVAAMLLLLAGCQTSQVVMNEPLAQQQAVASAPAAGYWLGGMRDRPLGPVMVVLSFSGGGKRSAAFAHGVLRGLQKMRVTEDGRDHALLDDVAYISAVSGGSFPAMHYGLYREQSFVTFPQEFLYRDIGAYIWGMYLLPWNWEWLINPLYGTNDRMAEIYDRLMFHGATYADLLKRGLPVIAVNATDIANGVSFSFVQPSFDLLCSDLLRFPVARAVAASNGFPVLFTPITISSFEPNCSGPRTWPELTAEVPETGIELSRRAELARQSERYRNPSRTKYVHLMDGGIADNLALRSVLNALIAIDEHNALFRQFALRTRRVVVISADGQASTDPTLGQRRIVTGLGQIFSAVSGTQIDAYNFETLLLADQQIRDLVERMRKVRCATAPRLEGRDCADVAGGLVHLSLADVADPTARARLQTIPTGLTIPKEDVDLLVGSGERIVQQDPAIAGLLAGSDLRVAAGERPGQ